MDFIATIIILGPYIGGAALLAALLAYFLRGIGLFVLPIIAICLIWLFALL